MSHSEHELLKAQLNSTEIPHEVYLDTLNDQDINQMEFQNQIVNNFATNNKINFLEINNEKLSEYKISNQELLPFPVTMSNSSSMTKYQSKIQKRRRIALGCIFLLLLVLLNTGITSSGCMNHMSNVINEQHVDTSILLEEGQSVHEEDQVENRVEEEYFQALGFDY